MTHMDSVTFNTSGNRYIMVRVWAQDTLSGFPYPVFEETYHTFPKMVRSARTRRTLQGKWTIIKELEDGAEKGIVFTR